MFIYLFLTDQLHASAIADDALRKFFDLSLIPLLFFPFFFVLILNLFTYFIFKGIFMTLITVPCYFIGLFLKNIKLFGMFVYFIEMGLLNYHFKNNYFFSKLIYEIFSIGIYI